MHVKQVIVIRKDLNMRMGKVAAQSAHAAMKAILDSAYSTTRKNGWSLDGVTKLTFPVDAEMRAWLEHGFTKICVYVNSEEELMQIYEAAYNADLRVALIEDSGKTEFHGVVTKTCLAIGPNYSNEIDKITGNLKLL